MQRGRIPCIIVLTIGLMASSPLALEPLSEEELDRTVASGLELPAADQRARSLQGTRPAGEDSVPASREDESSEGDEVSFVAYREALPVVMSRMTNTPGGPLGAHGSYSLSPLSVIREQGTIQVPVLQLGPLPPFNPPIFIGR